MPRYIITPKFIAKNKREVEELRRRLKIYNYVIYPYGVIFPEAPKCRILTYGENTAHIYFGRFLKEKKGVKTVWRWDEFNPFSRSPHPLRVSVKALINWEQVANEDPIRAVVFIAIDPKTGQELPSEAIKRPLPSAEVTSLQSELVRLRATVSLLATENQQLNSALTEYRNTVALLQKKLSDIISQNEELRRENLRLKLDYREAMQSLEAIVQAYDRITHNLRLHVGILSEQVGTLISKLAQFRDENIVRLTQDIKSVTRVISDIYSIATASIPLVTAGKELAKTSETVRLLDERIARMEQATRKLMETLTAQPAPLEKKAEEVAKVAEKKKKAKAKAKEEVEAEVS